MKLLQRSLKAQAVLWALWGLAALAIPAWISSTVLGQARVPETDVWLRLTGVLALTVALLMVLISQRIADVWWWSWAFAVLELSAATVLALHLLLGLPDGARSWPWLVLAGVCAVFGVLLLLGLVRAEQEKPFV